jgi:hypothetical protein
MSHQPVPAINKALSTPVYIFRGAAKPFSFGRQAAGVYTSFDGTLKCIITPRGVAPFTLTVGSGITLSAFGAVANAKVRIALSGNQSILVPVGDFTAFKIIEGTFPNELIVIEGRMIGQD